MMNDSKFRAICILITSVFSFTHFLKAQDSVGVYPDGKRSAFRGRNVDLVVYDNNQFGASFIWPIAKFINPRASVLLFDGRTYFAVEDVIPFYQRESFSLYATLGFASNLDFNDKAPIIGIGSIYHAAKYIHITFDVLLPVTDDIIYDSADITIRGGIGYSF